MHIPGSRTARHLVRRWVRWPLTDAAYALGLMRGPVVDDPGGRGASHGARGPAVPRDAPLTRASWARLSEQLSERGSRFFSDNLVSNESSYLQVAERLEQVPKGLAYVGVGPEQSFAYVATLEPSLAFVVDVRRDNLTQHLLYKALFEEAATRAEWLALLLGRERRAELLTETGAPLELVLGQLDRCRPDDAAFGRAHQRLKARLEPLGSLMSRPPDWRRLEQIHRRFFERQLDIAFELYKPGRHCYPTLRSLLVARSPEGKADGFLGSAERFGRVQRLQREHRIVPVVGDFAGHRSFAGIASVLRRRGCPLGALYASNVEQMVWEQRRWRHFIRNLRALPMAPEAVVVRSYVDQGRRHPRQMAGHRMTSLAGSALGFLESERRRPHDDYWDVVTRPEAQAATGARVENQLAGPSALNADAVGV